MRKSTVIRTGQQLPLKDTADIGAANGQGEQDDDASVGWTKRASLTEYVKPTMALRRAAEQGNADAQYELSCMLQHEEDEWLGGDEEHWPNDGRESSRWLRIAAAQGQPEAQFLFGLWYRCGYIVQRDTREAVKWLLLSARQGNADAQYELGEMYFNGNGVRKDMKKAAYWFGQAAGQRVLPKSRRT